MLVRILERSVTLISADEDLILVLQEETVDTENPLSKTMFTLVIELGFGATHGKRSILSQMINVWA